MRNRHTATFILCASLLCNAAAAPALASVGARGQAPASGASGAYTATVKSGEARFTLPVPQRPEWRWHTSETKERGREYVMAVKVINEGKEYSFGFFLWKLPGATPRRGGLAALVDAGQESLFERIPNGHNIIVRDAGLKVRAEGDHLVITVKGRKNVARLFSGHPTQVTFETSILDESPTSQTVPVTYEN
jgi:hypothetical protein